jgi:hypothetical protein
MYRSLVELIAELHANSLSDLPALAAHPVDLAASDSVTDLPSSRARNSPGETSSYFSFKRWYGALGQPGSGTDGQGETGQSSDEVTQQFRRAIRRAREADGTASTASSCSSESYDTCVDSPASSTTTWTTSPGESGAQKDAGGIESTPFPSGYGAEDSPPPLRAAQSVATLRAPRILRKSASSASLTSTSVQVPPRSPYTPPSPVFTTAASPVLDQYSWLSEPPAPSSTFTPPADLPPSTFGSRLASSLRKSASSFTLRLSARRLETPPMPSPPSLNANDISVMSANDTTKTSSSLAGTAADRLRDLLLQHDAVVDPSIDPITPLFDPKLARSQGYRSDSDDSSSEDEGEGRASSETEAQEAFEVEQLLRGVSPSTPPPRSAFDPNSSEEDDDDDPFAANARSEIAWMAPSTPDVAPLFFDDEPLSDSPSGAFPPFDPYGFTYARPPMSPLPPISPPRPSRTKVITKKRSFVDPRTRRIRTAPTVTVTPSTPERQRTRY